MHASVRRCGVVPLVRRLAWVSVVASCVVFACGGPASAKVLPVTELTLTTRRAETGTAIGVTMRFDPRFHIGDWPAVREGEVAVLPKRRTTAAGWPSTNGDLG